MPRTPLRWALACVVAAAPALGAQGALSNQGFGYPVGQLSAAAAGTSGASAESDPNSSLNPAAISQNSRYSLMLQFEPEFRRTTVTDRAASARVMRFPAFTTSGSYGRFTGAAGVTTLLDRSWSNSYQDSLFIGGGWVPSRLTASSAGAISDARVALAYVVHRRLQVGVGLHGLTGENRVEFFREFPDTTGVGNLAQFSSIGYSGTAVSAGVVVHPLDGVVVAASHRRGGAMSAEQNDTEVGSATVPSRTGVGVTWLAVPGASLNARYDRTSWTQMVGLGSSNVSYFDATDVALGAEFLGPRLGGVNSVLRAGLRQRSLPFGVLGERVDERSASIGTALPVARGRGQIDLALQRATRSALTFSERGWFLSVGLGIRP